LALLLHFLTAKVSADSLRIFYYCGAEITFEMVYHAIAVISCALLIGTFKSLENFQHYYLSALK